MSRSSALRLSDLRSIYQLVGECRELGDDPVLWRRHLLAGLSPLTGGEFGVSAEVGDGRQRSRYDLGTVDIGADNGFERDFWLQSLTEFGKDAFFNPLINTYFDRSESGVVRPRAEFVPDEEWYPSFYYQGVHCTLGADHSLLSLRPIPGTPDDHCGLYLLRHIGARDFNRRECAIASEAMAAVAPLVGGALARFGEPSPSDLPHRARQVLRCLLEGDGDKQVAARLGLSRHTVNQYAKVIFAHFGAQSRGELLARWIRRGWGNRCAWDE
jgi:DNA-binding CsgD family transcriptional regulator